MSVGSRAKAEDYWGFLTSSEGPKGAQCAFTEGLVYQGLGTNNYNTIRSQRSLF